MKRIIVLLIFTMLCMQAIMAQTDSVLIVKKTPEPKKHRFLPNSRNAVKFNVLSPFYSNLCIASQHMIDEEKSFQITASYMDFTGVLGGSGDTYDRENQITKMVSFTPEFRYNLNGKHLSGVYFGTFLRYYYMNYSYDLNDWLYNPFTYNYTRTKVPKNYTYQVLGIGLVFGNQTIFKRKIVVDSFIGPIYSIMLSSTQTIRSNDDLRVHEDIPNLFLRGYGIRAGFFIGLAY